MFRLKMSKRLKKILKLNRKIAIVNGRKGFAFDAQKIPQSMFDDYKEPAPGLEKRRRLMSYFNFSIDLLRNFMVLVNTNKGIYLLKDTVEVTLDLTPGRECIQIQVSGEVLQDVEVFGFKILDPSAACVKVPTQIHKTCLNAGTDTFNVVYDILA